MDRRLAPKCIKIARPMVNGYLVEREEYEYWAKQLFDLLKSGDLKVKINKIFPLAEVQQAHKVSFFISVAQSLRNKSNERKGSGGKKDHRKDTAQTMRKSWGPCA